MSPTGEQWSIGHGRQRAVITEVGATLRVYTVDDLDVIDGFGPGEWAQGGRGQVLAPWPNRLGDGRYEFAGVHAQAPLDEPERGNAIHGLVRWLPWKEEARAQNVVLASCSVRPTPGYPFCLELKVEYRLGRDGLSITATASNRGEGALPFGLGFHPYVHLGTDRIDDVTLRLPSAERLVLDARGLPTGEAQSVVGTEFDFSSGRRIGPTQLDTCFSSLRRDEDDLSWASIDDPVRQRGLDVWMDQHFAYLMCYTGDTLGDATRRRRSIAIEPMSCPPDALRSGRHLVGLEPEQEWSGSWGLRPR
jgi:galactose mutarotase-like enzyme